MTCAAGNLVSFATGTSDEHEALQTVAGEWVLWSWGDPAGTSARPVDAATARRWLLRNEHFEAADRLEQEAAAKSVPVPAEPEARFRPPKVAQVYGARAANQGRRVLVDRLWPRGLARASGQFDVWLKEIAPSSSLRRWYGHRPDLFPEFRRRYAAELVSPPWENAVAQLLAMLAETQVTLVTATPELALSAAAVLAEELALGLGRADNVAAQADSQEDPSIRENRA